MSWDFSMEVDAGGPEPVELGQYEANCTYNLAPMFFEAFGDELSDEQGERRGIRGLHGMTGAEAAVHLSRAIERMTAQPSHYEAMNPENGWGDYDGALRTLWRLLAWCTEAPLARMVVS